MQISKSDGPCVAVLSIWNDIDPDIEHEYEAWYQQDHLRERVSVPGFKSCRRYERVAGDGRRYFTFSDIESIEAVKSDAYVESLRNPTEWTRRIMPHFRKLIRVVANVPIDRGDGIGGYAATALYDIPVGAERAEARSAVEAALDAITGDARVTRVRVFESHVEANQLHNPEAALRPDPQLSVGVAVVIEGSYPEAVETALRTVQNLPQLSGAPMVMPVSVYRLLFSSRS